MRELIDKIKEKFREIVLFLKNIELSERIALSTTIIAFVLLIIALFLIINFILPRARVEISISGPETIRAGEKIAYTVTVKNTGNVILKNPELVFQFPSASLPEKSLVDIRPLPVDLHPRQEEVLTFRGQLFGAENTKREVKAWLDYSTEKQPAPARSRIADFSTAISEVPIDLLLDMPEKISIYYKEETDFIFRIRYFSSLEERLSDLKLALVSPADFIFRDSIPARNEEKIWEISSIEYLDRGEIEIIGSFPKEQELEKELDFEVHLFVTLHGENVPLTKDSARPITHKPILLFSQKINNEIQYLPYTGERLHYEIHFRNIQEEPLRNIVLTNVLEGNLFDLFSVEAPAGTFYEGGRSISWDGERVPQLRYLTPGEEGKVEFWVNLKDDYKPKDATELNALIRNRVLLAGFETEFRYRVGSLMKISQEGYFEDRYGFFENPGRHPPRVNQATHYTIVWKLENYYNWLENARISATLPPGVRFQSAKLTRGEVRVITDPLERESPYPGIPSDFRFTAPLHHGMRNQEVQYLQIILKEETPAAYPARIPATGYFGDVTRNSVRAFQNKYKREILDPQNLTQPTGYVDELTRTKLNELLARGAPAGPAEIVWEVERVKPGIGALEEPWIAAFQIVFVPGMAQRGKIATLINEINASARDRWTEMILYSRGSPIDTTLPHDPSVRDGEIR